MCIRSEVMQRCTDLQSLEGEKELERGIIVPLTVEEADVPTLRNSVGITSG